jgi:hypothetical protein
MAFDSSLDKSLFSEQIVFEKSRITVGVFSYNNGTPKLQISRENGEGEEFTFAKLGRMTKEEAEKVMPAMQKALKHMQ